MTKVNKNNGLSTLRKTPFPLKSELCFCMASGHRDQKLPRPFSPFRLQRLCRMYPLSPRPFPVQGKGGGIGSNAFLSNLFFSLLICGQLTISKPCPARVFNSGFVGAGMVSFPRLDLSKCCQHSFCDWNSSK